MGQKPCQKMQAAATIKAVDLTLPMEVILPFSERSTAPPLA